MTVRRLTLLGCLSVILIGNAQTLQGYTIRLYPPDWQTALVVTSVPATAVVCGQPKMAGTAAPINPTKLLFDDPADPTKDCVYLDTAGVLRATSPFWPDAGPWQVSVSQRFDSGEMPESNRVTFTRTPVVVPPAQPAPPAVQMATKDCTVTLSAAPPDASIGWRAQFRRNGTTPVGSRDATAPFTRASTVLAGAHTFSVQWSKSDGTLRDSAVTSVACP